MSFVPNTDADRKEMLETIGVSSFDELIIAIPEEVKLKGYLNLPPTLSEYEATKLLNNLANMNQTASTHACFMGAGAYDHFIPSVVGSVLQKPEFKTAYTPYQAEVSQGTLQAMYEFQSLISELTGMDYANASMYDGGSSLAEACLMSAAHNRKTEFVFAGTINPLYVETVETITVGRNFSYIHSIQNDGTCDLAKLNELVTDKTSAVIVQMPNFLGSLEDVHEIEKIAHAKKAMFIVVANPISLGLLEAPGNYNADVVVGEGQTLGIPLSFGGPYLGLFAFKSEFVRKVPGRLCGVTEDSEGVRSFVLTLQTREQQIKRDKATSNICTNQGLFMLAATVYMETMGKNGIKEVAEQSFQRAHYLADKISSLKGFKLANNQAFFNEFLVETPVAPSKIIDDALEAGFLAGIDVANFGLAQKGLLIAVTEKRTQEELDNFVSFLSKYSN